MDKVEKSISQLSYLIFSFFNDSHLLAPKYSEYFTGSALPILYSWSDSPIRCSAHLYSRSGSLIGSAYLFLYISFCFGLKKNTYELDFVASTSFTIYSYLVKSEPIIPSVVMLSVVIQSVLAPLKEIAIFRSTSPVNVQWIFRQLIAFLVGSITKHFTIVIKAAVLIDSVFIIGHYRHPSRMALGN